MNSFEYELKVRLTIPVVAESYKDGLKQIETYLLKQDIIADYDIIDVDCYCEGEEDE